MSETPEVAEPSSAERPANGKLMIAVRQAIIQQNDKLTHGGPTK